MEEFVKCMVVVFKKVGMMKVIVNFDDILFIGLDWNGVWLVDNYFDEVILIMLLWVDEGMINNSLWNCSKMLVVFVINVFIGLFCSVGIMVNGLVFCYKVDRFVREIVVV